jgi:hypothetical protein
LFHFLLSADNGSSVTGAVVTLAIYDQSGNLVFTMDAPTGQPAATGVVYLQTGTYTVRTSVKSSSGVFWPITYALFGQILSDPISTGSPVLFLGWPQKWRMPAPNPVSPYRRGGKNA